MKEISKNTFYHRDDVTIVTVFRYTPPLSKISSHRHGYVLDLEQGNLLRGSPVSGLTAISGAKPPLLPSESARHL